MTIRTWKKFTHSRFYDFLFGTTFKLRDFFSRVKHSIMNRLFTLAEEKPKRFILALTMTSIAIGIALTVGTQVTYQAVKQNLSQKESIEEKYGLSFSDFSKEDITESINRKTDKEEIFTKKKEFLLFLYTENTENYEYLKTVDKYKDSKTKLPLVLLQADKAKKVDESISLRDGDIELLHIRNGKEVNRLTGQIPISILPKMSVMGKETKDATAQKEK